VINAEEEATRLRQELVAMRRMLGMYQKDLVEQTGFPLGTLKSCEAGSWHPTLVTFIKWVDALGMEIKLVLKDEEDE
jgi:predicted transcriptional regulator